jgi:hypothetical protein
MAARGLTQEPASFVERDEDRDGVTGLMEFALDGDPLKADTKRLQILRDSDGRIGLEFHRWPGAPELSYVLEHSASLSGWHDLAATEFEEKESEILPSGIERVRIYLRNAPFGAGYLRLKIQLAE